MIQPIGHNAQVQRLTTALKNICRDYPAGGGVLRELLQNADDAGATSVKFFLDQRTYPAEQLVHHKLAQYQGPALLAYNNAVFTDKDFQSLSRIGDSIKLGDGLTTGKFGRGFNSVYNWTDSPSIVSRERFLILDPHLEWSDGGPVYDFVANSEEAEIKNHMAAFRTVMEHLDQPLEGTIIRIPLRTKAQANKSEISERETTVAEVLDVLQIFASEFGDNGLLFMKNVDKLEIKSTGGLSIGIEMVDSKMLRSHKSKVNDAIKSSLINREYSLDYSFRAGIEYRSNEKSKQTTFVVHHSIHHDLIDSDLKDWAEGQKLIPWVAVAAQVQSSNLLTGSLFTVLPLPIKSSQPVHIHGLFSLSPDRARLYRSNNGGIQDHNPAIWNDRLLQGSVPIAWAKLLGYLAKLYPNEPAFTKWPQIIADAEDPLRFAISNLIDIIDKEGLCLWTTETGYVTANQGLLDAGDESVALKEALREARVPVVYAPPHLRQAMRPLFEDRGLCPRSLCFFLKREILPITTWSSETKYTILDYLLSDPGFIDYHGIEIFPFEDGNYRSIGNGFSYVHRDKLDNDLFHLDKARNIDLEKISPRAQQILRNGCKTLTIHPSIRYRSASCFREYCMEFVFQNVPKHQDMVVLPQNAQTFIPKLWTWLSYHGIDVLDEAISGLWLLPLSNGHHRKIQPDGPSSQIYLAPTGEIGNLMWEFDNRASVKPQPLLASRPAASTHVFMSILTKKKDILSALSIKDASNIATFLHWLNQTSALAGEGADEKHAEVARLIAPRLYQLRSSDREAAIESIKVLPIFQKISWIAKGTEMERILTWTTLRSSSKTIGLLNKANPLPEITGVQFLAAEPQSPAGQIIQTLKLVECLGPVGLIENHIIPAWKTQQNAHWTVPCKEQLSKFILHHFSTLSSDAQAELRSLPLVPVARLKGKDITNFALATELLDPSVPELKRLCFDDEAIFPEDSYLRDFEAALKGCGLKYLVDEDVIMNRVRCYASTKNPFSDRKERAQRLLQSSCKFGSPQEDSEIRRLQWLPTIDSDSILTMKAADKCRSMKDRLLVSSQLPTLTIFISTEWEEQLGWNKNLPHNILLSQLNFGIEKNERKIVDEILTYSSRNNLVDALAETLKNMPCVLANNGLFILPSNAFRPPRESVNGCERLQPYLANIDRKFWQDHKKTLTQLGVGIGDKPGPRDLLNVQTRLEAKQTLEESDIAVAIEILNLASKFPRDSLEGIKVISEFGIFHQINEIYYNDLGHLKMKEQFHFTHPDIPLKTIKRLEISQLRERLLKGLLEIQDDDDEDEFDQRENVTTRISDTLDRYSLDSTFREFLANADDSAASRIDWLLDDRAYPHEKLLTREMRQFQGPAFLVHNDGVFSDNDFKGFKNVGEGSKAKDKETIGQFGRGSQTMFHFTDVPMILSGKYLLILDPHREFLPRNQNTGKRKPGVKLELTRLRDVCQDQLAPFEGLWGYTKSFDSYPGTIFRFPLRTTVTKSALRASKKILKSDEIVRLMNSYFDEARISLLFLRNIKSISFGDERAANRGWKITRQPSLEDVKSFTELVICNFERNSGHITETKGTDKWWVAIEDLETATGYLPDNSRRVMKNVECGLAGLISTTLDGSGGNTLPLKPSLPRLFNTLPLPISSDLPVHVHATFSLSGDRQSILIDEYGLQSNGAKWNRNLLEDALPNLYLQFLEGLGRKYPNESFRFWPQEDPPKRSCAELICGSFWKKLADSPLQLFPKSQVTSRASQRQAPRLFDIKTAVFDFLPEDQSETLATLLLSLDVNLVRNIPSGIAEKLKEIEPKVNSVAGPLLRQLFKTERGRERLLEKSKGRGKKYLEILYSQLIPEDTDQLKDLDGCHIVPLVDGSLATLKYLGSKDTRSSKYYVASEKELKLFEFASGSLVTSSTGFMLRRVLKGGEFNLTKLQLCHVEELLRMKPEVPAPDQATDEWLSQFWQYWNGHIDSSLSLSNIDNCEARIYRATQDGTAIYASPIEFEQLPAVVESSSATHQRLCDKIPGLYRFADNFMPKSTKNSFRKDTHFYRLIRAFRMLAGGFGITAFVEAHLDPACVEILRGLVVSNLSEKDFSLSSKQFLDLGNDTLNSITLWPCFNGTATGRLISATNALIATDSRTLSPWMKEQQRFVDPEFLKNSKNEDCLVMLGARKLATECILKDHILPLPATLSDTQWEHFKSLIAAVSSTSFPAGSTIFSTLHESKFAINGNRDLLKGSELYDHNDQIFASAFRHEKDRRFLHDDLQAFRSFWLKVGLRHRGQGVIESQHYLPCLQVLSRRLRDNTPRMDPNLESDSRTVLSPLTTTGIWIQKTRDNDWPAILGEKVFQSKTQFNDESEYRRIIMASVALEKPLLCLSQVISHDYVGICWSQISFPKIQPTKEVLSRVSHHGKPNIEMVLRHLERMKEVAQHLHHYQIRDFLKDLHLSYEYLQEHLKGTTTHYNLSSAIWLNLDTTDHNTVLLDDIKSSWYMVGELVLSSSFDAGPIKAVRPALMCYEKVLRALGCNSIIYPTITRPELQTGRKVTNSLRQLRKEEKLIDIKYSSEGRTIYAHRLVLAAMSEKCAAQFSGKWKVDDVIEYNKDTDADGFLSYHTLSTMINYAYEDEINWGELEVSENDDVDAKAVKLDLLLDLHKGADYWLIPALAAQVEDKILSAGRAFINLENVVRVRDRAREVRAGAVEKLCTEFIKQNLNSVEKVHGAV